MFPRYSIKRWEPGQSAAEGRRKRSRARYCAAVKNIIIVIPVFL